MTRIDKELPHSVAETHRLRGAQRHLQGTEREFGAANIDSDSRSARRRARRWILVGCRPSGPPRPAESFGRRWMIVVSFLFRPTRAQIIIVTVTAVTRCGTPSRIKSAQTRLWRGWERNLPVSSSGFNVSSSPTTFTDHATPFVGVGDIFRGLLIA
jgi:hypothetical protein